MTENFPQEVDTRPDDLGFYQGLARQKLEFHQALAELIDNSISAKPPGQPFTIEIVLEKEGDKVNIIVADNCSGISLKDLKQRVLKVGSRGSNPGPMNEHGWGLKNSLCVLTGNSPEFYVITRDLEAKKKNQYYIVKGPFSNSMQVDLAKEMLWSKNLSICISDMGTRVFAITSYHYFNSVYPASHIFTSLVPRLIEHLGVIYRGYLEDQKNSIWVRYREKKGKIGEWQEPIKVQPILIKDLLEESKRDKISIEYSGKKYTMEYEYGTLDKNLKDDASRGPPFPLKIYYKGNQKTQGIDIRVRGKVILPHQLEYIWPDLTRHNSLNTFIGELRIESPDFHTVNNKTEIDPQNPLWEALREKLDDLRPRRSGRALTEEGKRRTIAKVLKTVYPSSTVRENYPTWEGAGVLIDIHLIDNTKNIMIYEVKSNKAFPLDVYQLVMYWDGKVKAGERPSYGFLIAEDAPTSVKNMIKYWNSRKDAEDKNYKLEFKKISDIIRD